LDSHHSLVKKNILCASALGRSAKTKALLILCKLIFPAFPGRLLVGSKLQAPGNSVSPAERTEEYPRRLRMKVLVVGATGFVGSQVAQALSARGHQTRVLVRGGRAILEDHSSKAELRLSTAILGALKHWRVLAPESKPWFVRRPRCRSVMRMVCCASITTGWRHLSSSANRGGGKSGRQKVRLHLLLRKHSLRFATRERQAIL